MQTCYAMPEELDLSLTQRPPKLDWRLSYRIAGSYRKADVNSSNLAGTIRRIADIADDSRIVVTPLP